MKLTLKITSRNERKCVEVADDATVGTLMECIATTFKLERNLFRLSLNNKDYIEETDENNLLKTLGVVSGDILFVLPLDEAASHHSKDVDMCGPSSSGSVTSKPGSSSKEVPSPSSPPVGAGSSQGHSSHDSQANDACIQVVGDLIETNASAGHECIILLIHAMLTNRGFTMTGAPEPSGLAAIWNATASAGFYRFTYTHPASDVSLEITVTVTGAGAMLICNGTAKVGDQIVSKQCQVEISDHIVSGSSSPSIRSFVNAEESRTWLEDNLLNSLYSTVVGQESALARLPSTIRVYLFKLLGLKAGSKLGMTCQFFREAFKNEDIWRGLLLQDFGYAALPRVTEEFSGSYRRCYVSMYEARKRRLVDEAEAERRRRQDLHRQREPDFPGYFQPRDPFPSNPMFPDHPRGPSGIIGGPDDIMPIPGHVGIPNVFHPELNQPGTSGGLGGPRRPRGPRFDPVFPDDPDAGLHPFPDEGPRRGGGRGGRGRGRGGFPSNPFGGGFPDFL